MADRWFKGEGDGRELAREATEGIVAVFAEHGPVLRALADAAADDPDVEAAYVQLVQSFVDVTAVHIRTEIEAGRILPLDPHETATALVWMNERYLTLSLGLDPGADRSVVAQTLNTIWSRVLYGAD
jgi:hypothetical protein